MSARILQKLNLPVFKPLPLLQDGKSQTLMSFVFPYFPYVSGSKQHTILLSDSDQLVLIENQPLRWADSKRIIVLVHGLTGSHNSKYMVRATQLLLQQGFKVIRMNLRGCGPGQGKAKQPYHSGRSQDVREVLTWIHQAYPNSPVTSIGFSLGANLVLKMAGEDAHAPTQPLDSVIAVSPPIDLKASAQCMIAKKNRLFDQYFVKQLREDVKRRLQDFPELPTISIPPNITIYEFDEIYTAPTCGFDSADDYYARASSAPVIEKIESPTLILHAIDDPVVNDAAFHNLPSKPNLDLLITQQGGHIGWLGGTGNYFRYGNHWMDRAIVEWVKWHDAQMSGV